MSSGRTSSAMLRAILRSPRTLPTPAVATPSSASVARAMLVRLTHLLTMIFPLLDERQHEESSTAVHGRILVEMLISARRTRCGMRQAYVIDLLGHLVVKLVSHCRLASLLQFAVPLFQLLSRLFWLPKQSPDA